jgi:hypothetical protein
MNWQMIEPMIDGQTIGQGLVLAAVLILWLAAELRATERQGRVDELTAETLRLADAVAAARVEADNARLGPALCPQTECPLRGRLAAEQTEP